MFNAIGWHLLDQHESTTDGMSKLSTITPPQEEETNKGGYYNENSKVFIIKRFDFSSKLQRMSTIIRDLREDKQRVYVKGSPEMIRTLCKDDTIPETFSYALSQYAQVSGEKIELLKFL